MNTNTMRFLDHWVGKLLCFKLTCWRRLRQWIALEIPATEPPHKILFIKLVEQGATVLAASAIRNAQELVGAQNVYICVFQRNHEIIDILGLISPANQFHIRSDHPIHLVRDILNTVIRVRRLGIDAIVDMEFFARGSAILAYLCGGARRIGLHGFLNDTPYRGDLMTHRVSYNPYVHTAHAYRLLVQGLTHSPQEIPLLKIPAEPEKPVVPVFVPDPSVVQRVQNLLDAAFPSRIGAPRILLNPNPRDLLGVRKWPAERYVELGRRLLADYPEARIIFTGMGDERELLNELCTALDSPRVVNFAGKTSLLELVTLYTLADVLVTNDSGPAHFASATSIHQVVLFGPETPVLFSPLGDRTKVIYKQLACSPCLSAYNNRFSFCTENVCILSVSVDEVYALVRECLNSR